MNIDQMSLTELKALAYDTKSVMERASQNLTVINQKIANKLRESKMDEETPVVEETATESVVEETAAEESAEVAPTPEPEAE